MALATEGFRAPAPPIPQIPGNIGKIDVGAIYDAVKTGLGTAEMLRQTPARQDIANKTNALAAETAQTQRDVLPVQKGVTLATLDADLQQEQNRRERLRAVGALPGAQQAVIEKNGFPLATTASTSRLPDGRVSTTSTETAQVGNEVVPVKTTSNEGLFAMLPGIPANVRGFDMMTQGLSPEDQAKARGVALGITARPSSAAITYKEVVDANGATHLVAVDPRAVGAQVIGSGELYGSGVGGVRTSEPGTVPAATPQNSQVFTSPTIGAAEQQKAQAQEAAKLQAERQQKLPKAQASLQALDQKTNLVDQTIKEARQLVSPFTVGYGSLLDRLPTSDARALKAKLDTIRANIGFDALQEMRQNSPTGGALGNVSDYEGQTLQGTLAKLDTGLDVENFLQALDRVKQARHETLARVKNAYSQDFRLATEGGVPNAPAGVAPAAPAGGVPTFNTIEEANAQIASGALKIPAGGLKVLIGGKPGTLQP